jgi:hypothetical protein
VSEQLTPNEVAELAKLFPPGLQATQLLEEAGFQRAELPGVSPTISSLEYWNEVNVKATMVENLRRQVLGAAAARYPFNKVFKASLRRILFLGASPQGPETLRADREFRAVDAVLERTGLDLHHRPAATLADFDGVRLLRPDLLHLSCHGEGTILIFENAQGAPARIDAAEIAETLRKYRAVFDVQLAGIVLNACLSEPAADLLASCAPAVVAHRGDLEDDCAIAFSERLYRVLAESTGSLLQAAEVAAQEVAALTRRSCRAVRDDLVLRDGPGPDGH